MESDILDGMDETKDHELRVDTVKVATVITTTSTRTETVTVTTEEIVEDESEKVGPEEGRDVMVEVLGSEVFVDGVTRHGGELGGDELGGGAGERVCVGNGDGVGEMEEGDGGVENSVSELCHGGASGNGGSVPVNDGVQEVEAHEKVVERNLGDEGGGTAVGLPGNSNELSEGSGPVRSDQIENGSRDSMLQVTSMAYGTKDIDAEQSREPVENEGDGGDSEVVDHPPEALDLRSGEPLMSKEGDDQGMSKLNAPVIESVEATYMDDRSSCMESAECSSVDLNPLGIEDKVVEEQMQDPSVQTQVKDTDILHKTGKEEVAVVDSVARDSETASPELSDMQTQVGTGEKYGDADSVNVLCTEPSLMAKASDDILCHRVNGQQLDVSNVRIGQETLKQSAGDQELLPETTAHGVLDKAVVNEETEREIDTGNDSELTIIVSDKDVVSEDPEKNTLLSGMDNISKATFVTSKVSDNDEEVQCCGDKQKLVTCSEVDQNMKTKTVIHADMRSSDESSFACRGEPGEMDMEVEDSVPKNETLSSVKDEKPNDCSDSSDPSGQNTVLLAAIVDDKSGVATEMKDMDGNAMEIDDATQNPDCPENQKVDEKIICDGIENNGDPQLECAVEGISVVGMDIDAVNASSVEQGKGCAVHQNDLMSNKDMVIEKHESEAVLFTDSTIGTASADKNPTSAEGVPAAPSLDLAKEVTVGCKSTLNSALSKSSVEPVSSCVAEFVDPGSGQSKNVTVKVGSMDIPSANEEEKTRLSNLITDAILGQEDTEAEHKIHKMDERLYSGLPVLETEAANVPISDSVTADSDIGPKQDTHEESKGLAAHEQPPLPDWSLVKCVDQGPECEPDTSLGELSGTNATDSVAKVGSRVEESQVQEQAAVIDVPAAGSIKEDTNAFPKQDMYEEPEGHAAYDQSAMPNESLVNCVDGLESEHEASPGESLDKSATVGVPHVCSNMDEELNMSTTLEVEVPDVLNAGSTVADLGAHPKQDGNEEFEGHAAHEQPFQEESFVQGANQGLECQPDTSVVEGLDRSASDNVVFDDTNMEDIHDVQEEAALTEQVESPGELEVDGNTVSDSAKPRSKDEKNAKRGSAKPGSIVRDHRISYQLPPENDGEFSVFDLVWGKVKSHPWWPGQIFHPSDSSEKAMKYFRKDCYLVAYFGDRSFAWNEASVLKPFRKHFSQEERQNNSESFRNAVNCALEEVSRRVELGLACSCISEDAYEKIKYQIVENAGIREESRKREGVDSSSGPNTLEPAKLLDYVRALAASASSGADRLDLVIAKAQLSAFCRLKGCDALPDFEYYEGLSDVDHSHPEEQGISCEGDRANAAAGGDGKTRSKGPHKRKHNLKDIVYQRRKEKSLTELMGETMYYLDGDFDSHEEDDFMLGSPTSGMKRKASDCPMEDCTAQQNTKTISFAKVSQTASPNPQQSFKVGECIRRVASQLTASPSIIKTASDGGNSKDLGENANEVDTPDDSLSESTMIPQKQSSLEDMLSQLHLSARDPMKGYSFFVDIINFFSEFRNVAVTTQRQQMRKAGRKRKPSVPNVKTPETFEFDDRNDSYWTDMVIQNNSEVKTSRRGRKRKDDQLVSVDPEKPLQSKPRKYSRKQYFHGTHETATEVPSGDEKKQDQLPTELMLNFSDVGSIPSEINLNKMFRRFGPLKESETEVDSQSSRARLVFKKRSDAEVAYSSAAMFNIFGSTLVNYQLNYTPSASFRISALALTDTVEHAT